MILSPPRAEARFDEVDGGLTPYGRGSQHTLEWGSLVPVGYAEKSMASLMQLHSELMEEKERRVELHQRLMDKEQVLAELRMYVKLLEEKLAEASKAKTPEAKPSSNGTVPSPPKLNRRPTPPRPPNPNRPRISVRVRPIDPQGAGNGVLEPAVAPHRNGSSGPVSRSSDPSATARPSAEGWRTW